MRWSRTARQARQAQKALKARQARRVRPVPQDFTARALFSRALSRRSRTCRQGRLPVICGLSWRMVTGTSRTAMTNGRMSAQFADLLVQMVRMDLKALKARKGLLVLMGPQDQRVQKVRSDLKARPDPPESLTYQGFLAIDGRLHD